MERAENDAVLRYLWVEQLPSWRTSKSIWIVDGYSLATHPDLCERVERINDAAGTPATFRYLYGKPALIAANGVVVAFAKGTHTFCVRLPAGACDTDLLAPPREADSRFPALAQKQRELDALTAGEWTRLDPYSVNMPRDEGLARLADHVARAVATAISHSSE
ncbi:MAG: hypothetical protein E6G50_13695 [Actinobacteria bacterium]|nr:MAG: hypothetical protein E6G50_13695 [Actinomycetota bacterium]